uniref:Translation initiation factor IF-2, chloroplastic n=1 Tax=Plocamium cartilagineum TaxID=31452 RepID=A0A1C9CHN2_PLOCA|nr:translation initiation factor 2 [Plocamium cartilagineum]AOM67869.1 translation initiation factor 2 [Plocamium cartilagineum]
MVNNFLYHDYKLFLSMRDMLYSYFCLSMEKSNGMLALASPKLIYNINEITNSSKEIVVDLNANIVKFNKTSVETNFSTQFDKKNKNSAKQDDNLEYRKNKSKIKKKNRNKINIQNEEVFVRSNYDRILNEDSLIRSPKSSKSKRKIKNEAIEKNQLNIDNSQETSLIKKDIFIDNPLTIKELAAKLIIPEAEIITWLFLQGISLTINQIVDMSIIISVASHYNFNIIEKRTIENLSIAQSSITVNSPTNVKRSPIITILGHVDHGKTSLLDAIRNTNLVNHEQGGITQTIRGYEVEYLYKSSIEKLIFLDTPGHEAFTSMRSFSTNITDIILLVVAADDGLKPQTIEAIEYIQQKNLFFIVIINKIDKKDINILRIKEDLAKYDIIDKNWGGDTLILEVSALKRKNIDLLLSSICMLSESKALQADPCTLAKGTILEAHLDKTRGPIANIIMQNGTLSIGDIIVAGKISGKVKVIIDHFGLKQKQALPSSLIEVWGFSSVPESGVSFQVLENEKDIKQYFNKKENIYSISNRVNQLNTRVTLDSYNNVKSVKQLNLILKTDNQGSIEAILYAFSKIPQEKVQINILSISSGLVNDTDIELALTSKSIIISFNISITSNSMHAIQKSKLIYRNFNVIYDLLDYIKDYMLNLVDPEYKKVLIGSAIVQTIFLMNKGTVAGCLVNSGKLKRGSSISVYRDTELVYDGYIDSLKRLKEDVDEVIINHECGLMCLNYNLWQKQDRIEAYELNESEKFL